MASATQIEATCSWLIAPRQDGAAGRECNLLKMQPHHLLPEPRHLRADGQRLGVPVLMHGELEPVAGDAELAHQPHHLERLEEVTFAMHLRSRIRTRFQLRCLAGVARVAGSCRVGFQDE